MVIQRICQWIVERAGLNLKLNAAMANQYLISSEPKPDRPDLEAIQRQMEAEIVAKDEALARMQAAIEDLDRRLRRSDPIVQQAVSQDSKSATYEMCVAMFTRLGIIERQFKKLDAANRKQSEAALLEAGRTAEPDTPVVK